MADKTPLPTHDQLKKLLDTLLPPDEEMDEVSSAVILEEMGVDTGALQGDLRARLEREVQELRAKGEDLPQPLLAALSSLRPKEEPEDQTGLDPEVWVDNLIAGRMPGHLTGSGQAQHLRSFRARNVEFLAEEDRRILEELVAELQSEMGEG
ncbi:MAG: hypothetical protein LC802_23410 [Acidobacteria bacterium]|nr:hypothetical protein [Acidobacteriota bacterium]